MALMNSNQLLVPGARMRSGKVDFAQLNANAAMGIPNSVFFKHGTRAVGGGAASGKKAKAKVTAPKPRKRKAVPAIPAVPAAPAHAAPVAPVAPVTAAPTQSWQARALKAIGTGLTIAAGFAWDVIKAGTDKSAPFVLKSAMIKNRRPYFWTVVGTAALLDAFINGFGTMPHTAKEFLGNFFGGPLSDGFYQLVRLGENAVGNIEKNPILFPVYVAAISAFFVGRHHISKWAKKKTEPPNPS